jgi:hypothetical protein
VGQASGLSAYKQDEGRPDRKLHLVEENERLGA